MFEIKFRGFHQCENGKEKIFINGDWICGKWVYGYYCCAELLDKSGYEHVIIETSATGKSYVVIPETVGQYTGMKDKREKELYCGDTVRFCHDCYVCKIIYEYGTFGLTSNKPLEPFSYEDYGMCDDFVSLFEIYWNCDDENNQLSDVEYMGNVFENPEILLKND